MLSSAHGGNCREADSRAKHINPGRGPWQGSPARLACLEEFRGNRAWARPKDKRAPRISNRCGEPSAENQTEIWSRCERRPGNKRLDAEMSRARVAGRDRVSEHRESKPEFPA